MPTPGVSGASHHILKRLPLRQFSFRESSYLLLQALDSQGQNSPDCPHVTLLLAHMPSLSLWAHSSTG